MQAKTYNTIIFNCFYCLKQKVNHYLIISVIFLAGLLGPKNENQNHQIL